MTTDPQLLVVGVGGLGSSIVGEALGRGVRVSVLVRNAAKLEQALGPGTASRLDQVFVGDGTDPVALEEAMTGMDVVLSGFGANPTMAQALAEAVRRNSPDKLVWPAGTTNVKDEDGVTPNYRRLLSLGAWVEPAYRAHQACIDAIRATGITSVIFCPGVMRAVGRRSAEIASRVRIDRDGGPFTSYEDAAWVMVEAAVTDRFDNQLVSVGTLTDPTN